MIKICLVIAGILLANAMCIAQEFQGYGVVNSEEINLKQCSFDKDANAVILMHEAYSDYDDDHHLITRHHIRMKILKEDGISSANISIPFYRKDDFEQIDMIDEITINPTTGNEVVNTGLERKSIFVKKTNEWFGEVVFACPAIKVGSIIEYKYRSIMKSYGGLKDWKFQEELPVVISKYTLVLIPNTEFAYQVSKATGKPIIIKKEPSIGSIYFEMREIPGLGDEPYMDARQDYLQKVVFQLSAYDRYGNKSKYMTSWDEVTRELTGDSEFGGQLNKNIAGTDDFIKQTKTLISPEDRMKAVYNYVRSNVNWNGTYSKYVVDGVKDAWQKKSGSSGDINLLLVNLLKAVSLDAYPMLVSERFHGKVNPNYPFIDQFNSVFACVMINNRKYYLDATDKANPPHLTPYDILNTTAFIVNRKAGGLTKITNDTVRYKENIIVNIDLAEDGSISGEAAVNSENYARIKKLTDFKTEKNKFLARYFVVDGTGISGKDLEVTNVDNDSMPLAQHCKLSGSLTKTGEYSFLPLNMFTGFNINPFVSDNRFSNINFGYPRVVNLNMFIGLPANYLVDEVPKSVRLTTPDNDIIFTRQINYNKGESSATCMLQLEFKKSLYEADMYPVIKDVYQRIFDYLKEPIVLKRK